MTATAWVLVAFAAVVLIFAALVVYGACIVSGRCADEEEMVVDCPASDCPGCLEQIGTGGSCALEEEVDG